MGRLPDKLYFSLLLTILLAADSNPFDLLWWCDVDDEEVLGLKPVNPLIDA